MARRKKAQERDGAMIPRSLDHKQSLARLESLLREVDHSSSSTLRASMMSWRERPSRLRDMMGYDHEGAAKLEFRPLRSSVRAFLGLVPLGRFSDFVDTSGTVHFHVIRAGDRSDAMFLSYLSDGRVICHRHNISSFERERLCQSSREGEFTKAYRQHLMAVNKACESYGIFALVLDGECVALAHDYREALTATWFEVAALLILLVIASMVLWFTCSVVWGVLF